MIPLTPEQSALFMQQILDYMRHQDELSEKSNAEIADLLVMHVWPRTDTFASAIVDEAIRRLDPSRADEEG